MTLFSVSSFFLIVVVTPHLCITSSQNFTMMSDTLINSSWQITPNETDPSSHPFPTGLMPEYV